MFVKEGGEIKQQQKRRDKYKERRGGGGRAWGGRGGGGGGRSPVGGGESFRLFPPTSFSLTPFPFLAPLLFLPHPPTPPLSDKGMVHYGTNFIHQQLIAGYALCCNVSFGHYLLFIIYYLL